MAEWTFTPKEIVERIDRLEAAATDERTVELLNVLRMVAELSARAGMASARHENALVNAGLLLSFQEQMEFDEDDLLDEPNGDLLDDTEDDLGNGGANG